MKKTILLLSGMVILSACEHQVEFENTEQQPTQSMFYNRATIESLQLYNELVQNFAPTQTANQQLLVEEFVAYANTLFVRKGYTPIELPTTTLVISLQTADSSWIATMNYREEVKEVLYNLITEGNANWDSNIFTIEEQELLQMVEWIGNDLGNNDDSHWITKKKQIAYAYGMQQNRQYGVVYAALVQLLQK